MIIKETIERECCTWNDLKNYNGDPPAKYLHQKLKFCVYCGQLYFLDSQMDAAGGREKSWEKVNI